MRRTRAGTIAAILLLWFCGCKTTDTAAPASRAQNQSEALEKTKKSLTFTAENCMSDLWLASHHSVKDLASSGLPEGCCAADLLPEEEAWRCEMDWPSSDLPECSFWTRVHERLSEAIPAKARSPLVKTNLSTLSGWASEASNCRASKESP